ncbi:hypothetical protein D3C81_346870 [compost metagenome]
MTALRRDELAWRDGGADVRRLAQVLPAGRWLAWRPHAVASGFSLIELLAVLATISVLLALAVPAYHGHIVRAKRVQGQAALLRLMQQQERYYTQNNRYLAFSSASPAPQVQQFPWWSGDGPESGASVSAYEIEAVACPGMSIGLCVLLRAMPGTPKVDAHFHDAECGVLSLSSTGQRGSSGPASRCWP